MSIKSELQGWTLRLLVADGHPTWPGSDHYTLVIGDTGHSDRVQLFDSPELDADIAAMRAELERLRRYVGTEMIRSDYPTAAHMRAGLDAVKAENAELHQEVANDMALIGKLGKILARTANTLLGEPPEDTLWSWHDLAERVKALQAAGDRLADAVESVAKLHSNAPSMANHVLAAVEAYRKERGQ